MGRVNAWVAHSITAAAITGWVCEYVNFVRIRFPYNGSREMKHIAVITHNYGCHGMVDTGGMETDDGKTIGDGYVSSAALMIRTCRCYVAQVIDWSL